MTGPRTPVSADAAIQLWIERFNTRDPAQIAALYSESATLLGTSKSRLYRGRAEILGYFTGGATVQLSEQIVQPLGEDTILSAGAYRFTRENNGEPVTTPARFSFVFQRHGDSWVVLHHHSSSNPD
jgi:hypothetical protein